MKGFLVAGVAVLSLFSTLPTWAQMNNPAPSTICGVRNEMVRALHDQFREEPQAVGQVDDQAVIEVFVSNTGTWTILATGTDGMSCLVASGDGWDTTKLIVGIDS